jgi:hypothetical protein
MVTEKLWDRALTLDAMAPIRECTGTEFWCIGGQGEGFMPLKESMND